MAGLRWRRGRPSPPLIRSVQEGVGLRMKAGFDPKGPRDVLPLVRPG
jgi:hypothetical protein